jgi:hypothetical protein
MDTKPRAKFVMFQEMFGTGHTIEVHYDRKFFELAMCGILRDASTTGTVGVYKRLNNLPLRMSFSEAYESMVGWLVQDSADYKLFKELFHRVFPDEELPPLPPYLSPLLCSMLSSPPEEALVTWQRLMHRHARLPRVLTMRQPLLWARRSRGPTPPSARAPFQSQDYRYPIIQLNFAKRPTTEMAQLRDRALRIEVRQTALEILCLLQPPT